MELKEIFSVIDSISLGDKLSINDWKAKYTVCGVSQNFILAHYGQHYTIISRRPSQRTYNGVRSGDAYCAPDWWIFGYVEGYNFTDEDWVKKYMAELEQGKTEMSMKRMATIWFISIIGHTEKVYAKRKNPSG